MQVFALINLKLVTKQWPHETYFVIYCENTQLKPPRFRESLMMCKKINYTLLANLFSQNATKKKQ